MTAPAITLDFRHEPGSRVQSAAFYALKDLARGNVVVLLTADEPSLMMQSLDLQLRHNLAWTISRSKQGWRVQVRPRADSVPLDVLDILTRDHQRLDALLAQAMRLVNQGDISAAAPLLREFAVALERHVAVEDAMLALFSGAETRAGEPVAIMQREHQEILGQFALIGECLASDPPQAGEIGAFCSILSGTLAKHEYREENNLFPEWRRAWARLAAVEQKEMMARAQKLLEGRG